MYRQKCIAYILKTSEKLGNYLFLFVKLLLLPQVTLHIVWNVFPPLTFEG